MLLSPHMSKKIFLAEDDHEYRQTVKEIMEYTGHQVVIETENFKEAISRIGEAVEAGVEVLITDRYMPNANDGETLAGELNAKIPELMIVSISRNWSGVWEDPLYNEAQPFPVKKPWQYDLHGRSRFKGPDLHAEQIGDLTVLARKIDEWSFSLVNEEVTADLLSQDTGSIQGERE